MKRKYENVKIEIVDFDTAVLTAETVSAGALRAGGFYYRLWRCFLIRGKT